MRFLLSMCGVLSDLFYLIIGYSCEVFCQCVGLLAEWGFNDLLYSIVSARVACVRVVRHYYLTQPPLLVGGVRLCLVITIAHPE